MICFMICWAAGRLFCWALIPGRKLIKKTQTLTDQVLPNVYGRSGGHCSIDVRRGRLFRDRPTASGSKFSKPKQAQARFSEDQQCQALEKQAKAKQNQVWHAQFSASRQQRAHQSCNTCILHTSLWRLFHSHVRPALLFRESKTIISVTVPDHVGSNISPQN